MEFCVIELDKEYTKENTKSMWLYAKDEKEATDKYRNIRPNKNKLVVIPINYNLTLSVRYIIKKPKDNTIPMVNHKGEWCIVDNRTFCQEGYCENCEKYRLSRNA